MQTKVSYASYRKQSGLVDTSHTLHLDNAPIARAGLLRLERTPFGIRDLDTKLDGVGALGLKDVVNLLEVELARLGEEEVGDYELAEVVDDVDSPNLVAYLLDADRDAIVMDDASSALQMVSVVLGRLQR